MNEDNKMDISRRGFLKTAALAGAALAMPAGLDKVFAAGPKQPETSRNDDTGIARIKGHRVLGTGKAHIGNRLSHDKQADAGNKNKAPFIFSIHSNTEKCRSQ